MMGFQRVAEESGRPKSLAWARAIVREFAAPGPSAADELIAERRAEVAREDAEEQERVRCEKAEDDDRTG